MYDDVKARIRGLVMNQPTPYDPATFEVDHDGIRRNIERWIENRVPVILLTFGTSDFAALSEQEIADVTRTTIEAVAGRALVIACTGMWWRGKSIEFARLCEQLGADVLMVVKHEPANMTAQDAHDFYAAIADAVDLPLLYHSFLTGPKSIEVVTRVADIPSVIGMKQETAEYRQYSLLRDALGDRLAVLTAGGGEMAYFGHQFGAVGSLTGTGQWAPGPEVAFVKQMLAGDFAGAKAHLSRILPFRRKAATLPNNIVAIKYAMDLAGLAGGPPRPLVAMPLTDAEKDAFAEIVYATGFVARPL